MIAERSRSRARAFLTCSTARYEAGRTLPLQRRSRAWACSPVAAGFRTVRPLRSIDSQPRDPSLQRRVERHARSASPRGDPRASSPGDRRGGVEWAGDGGRHCDHSSKMRSSRSGRRHPPFEPLIPRSSERSLIDHPSTQRNASPRGETMRDDPRSAGSRVPARLRPRWAGAALTSEQVRDVLRERERRTGSSPGPRGHARQRAGGGGERAVSGRGARPQSYARFDRNGERIDDGYAKLAEAMAGQREIAEAARDADFTAQPWPGGRRTWRSGSQNREVTLRFTSGCGWGGRPRISRETRSIPQHAPGLKHREGPSPSVQTTISECRRRRTVIDAAERGAT